MVVNLGNPQKIELIDVWPCDLCGAEGKEPIPEIPASVVCTNCGFVYVRERRNSEKIAKAWDDLWSEAYTSAWPGVIARLTYVAEFCDQTFGWKGKTVLDIGAGEGHFLEMINRKGATPKGLEPSPENAKKVMAAGFGCWGGTAETLDITARFDVITLNWTLENTGDCMAVLRKARSLLKPGGRIVVATGSRILVPFKKPFSTYKSDLPPDLHCYRWSANSLRCAMANAGFINRVMNDHEQNDTMICVAERQDNMAEGWGRTDDPQEVLAYFKSWKEQFP